MKYNIYDDKIKIKRNIANILKNNMSIRQFFFSDKNEFFGKKCSVSKKHAYQYYLLKLNKKQLKSINIEDYNNYVNYINQSMALENSGKILMSEIDNKPILNKTSNIEVLNKPNQNDIISKDKNERVYKISNSNDCDDIVYHIKSKYSDFSFSINHVITIFKKLKTKNLEFVMSNIEKCYENINNIS